MTLQQIKEKSESLIGNAQSFLRRDGALKTVIFTVQGDKMQGPVTVSSDESLNTVKDLMAELAQVSDALIVIMNAHLKWYDKKDVIPKSIKDEPDSFKSLTTIVHTKDIKTSLRLLNYQQDKEGNYYWWDEGWKDTEALKGNFGNPFMGL